MSRPFQKMEAVPSEPEPPEAFVCPITHELMDDPVFASDGHTYERRAIAQWLSQKTTSPKTGADLELPILIPDCMARQQILEWREAHGL